MSDTNVIVSAMLKQDSPVAAALRLVAGKDRALLSLQMRDELLDVFSRPKFDGLVNFEVRMSFLSDYLLLTIPVFTTETVSDCVDLKDNMILECALGGKADVIITGDDHLLRLDPWRGVAIMKPMQYLALHSGDDLS